jgi:hypothetical protein
MPTKHPSTRRVAMAKRLASKWISAHSSPEYRLTIFRGSAKMGNLPSLLRSFRDGKLRIANAAPMPDLGIQPEFDHVVVRSKDFDALTALDAAVQKLGCDTSGVY